jgi:hypothetical protein
MCDLLCALAPAASGRTLFAKNSDRPPSEAQVLERHDPRSEPSTRTTYLTIDPAPAGETIGFVGSRPHWMWGVEHGVNDAGVAVGNATIYTNDDPRGVPPGLIGMDLVRLALERASTTAEAITIIVELLERYGQGGSGHEGADRPYWSSFLVADATDATVVETSDRAHAAEPVIRTRAISNRTTIEAFDERYRHPRQPVATLVDPRLRESKAVLAHEPVTVDRLRAHLRSHAASDDGWSVCMHVRDVEATTASVVAELGGTGPPRAHVLLGSPCTSIYVPIVVGPPLGEPPEWDRFAAFTAAHRPVLDELEARLAAEFEAGGAGDGSAWHRYVWVTVGDLCESGV